MPEGPELHIAARFVNQICSGKLFSGKVIKSEVSTKNPDVDWNEPEYTITATSRGKEVMLQLATCENLKDAKKGQKEKKKKQKTNQEQKTKTVLVRFGMSGKFRFDPVEDIQKHAHLNFYTKDKKNVLSFVDYRRFGRWEVDAPWGKERGPCVILEYQQFRKNVLDNLDKAAFNRPICEALLNQKFFNGIGNYLRAEILYRKSIAPFACARDVLEPLKKLEDNDVKVKSEDADILALCNILTTEVINLSGGAGYDPEADEKDYSEFAAWLQCYYNPAMKNMVDSNGRTIWFQGKPGPLVPSKTKSRKRKEKTNLNKKEETEVKQDKDDEDYKPEVKKMRSNKRSTKKTTEKSTTEDVKPKKMTRKTLKSLRKDKNNNDKAPAKKQTGRRRSQRIASNESNE